MPELPEIKAHARAMKQALLGKTITNIEVLQPNPNESESKSSNSGRKFSLKTQEVHGLGPKCLNVPPETFNWRKK